MKLIKCECCGGNSLHKYSLNSMICDFCGSVYKLDENEEIVSKELIDAKMMSLFIEAEKCRQAEKYADALQIIIKAVELDENSAFAWVKLGRAYRECWLNDKALECYEKAISVDPNYPQTYSNIGTIHILNKDYQNAVKYYEKCIGLMTDDDKDYPAILANYALALALTGDKKRAAKLLDEAEKKGYEHCAQARKLAGISFWNRFFG